MPYPRAVAIMAQNLIALTASNPDLHKSKFNMLWNGILNHHFPIELQYGVALQASISSAGSKLEFFEVKVAREEEDIVLVLKLKRPAEDTESGRETIKKELVAHVEERFDETKYPAIYAIGGIGLSWVAYKMNKTSPSEPELFVAWSSNVTSATSYNAMQTIVNHIDGMTGTARQ